jgi:iduronate 2-sulfatase
MPQPTRRQFLQSAAAPLAARRRPNVLFIAVDDLRPELGAYGARHVHSPNMDRLARSGTLFNHAYCQQALCNPSRASLMTGLRPDTLRVWDLQTNFRTTRPDAVTIPQAFRASGYYAASIGKIFHNIFPDDISWSEPEMHIDGFPFDPDAVYRSPAESSLIEQRKQQLTAAGQQQRHIDRYGQWYLKSSATEAPDVPDNAYYDGAQTDRALSKLAELSTRNQPFFFGIGFYRPHLPFNAPKKYWDLYDRARIPLAPNPTLPQGAPLMAANINRELRGYRDFNSAPTPQQGTLSEAEARRLRHGYFASVSYIDAQIGRLLDQLDHLGLAQNTIVVLWGDHGWKLGEHNSWGKMTNYEIDTRVPLIVRAPGTPSGQTCEGLVEFVDLYPTLCELAQVPAPAALEGRSFAPLLRQPRQPGKSAIFSQYLRNGIWTASDGVEYMGYCVRTKRHRYVEWFNWNSKQFAASELYDLARDPQENHCLPGEPRLRQQLAKLLRTNFKLSGAPPTTRASASPPPADSRGNSHS